jgi:hypothetical protein
MRENGNDVGMLIRIGIHSSKYWSLLMDTSRIIVIVSYSVEALSTLIFSALINRGEWIQSRIHRYHLTISGSWRTYLRLPSLHHSSSIGTENIS